MGGFKHENVGLNEDQFTNDGFPGKVGYHWVYWKYHGHEINNYKSVIFGSSCLLFLTGLTTFLRQIQSSQLSKSALKLVKCQPSKAFTFVTKPASFRPAWFYQPSWAATDMVRRSHRAQVIGIRCTGIWVGYIMGIWECRTINTQSVI